MNWIETYPLRNNRWKGYFEDIRIDPENGNRDQLSALETARYLLEKKPADLNWETLVPGLIEWVKRTLGGPSFYSAEPIHEQKYCFFVMGSHTARYASLCAQWSAWSGNRTYAERAIHTLNWATYMAAENGTVTVGIDRPDYYNQCWFTDGYFDYVPHFIDCMAALPQLAPADQDHLLSSSGVITHIGYQPRKIVYHTFQATGQQVLRVTFKPKNVRSGNRELPELTSRDEKSRGWSFDSELNVLRVFHDHNDVEITG